MISVSKWQRPEIFDRLQRGGAVTASEMARTFNCGIGMAVVVAPDDLDRVMKALGDAGETPFLIGQIEEGERGCTVTGPAGSWGSDEEWSATHHG